MPDSWTLPLAALSLLISIASVAWGAYVHVDSGPRLRLHALCYGEVLRVRVFNSGRSADSLQHLVVGGHPTLQVAEDVTGLLNLPVWLEPGQAWHGDLHKGDVTEKRWRSLRAGWDSVWVLTGSMRQIRVEVVPQPRADPGGPWWRLAPRLAKARRFVPLIASSGAYLCLTSAWWLVVPLGIAAVRLYAGPVTVRAYWRLRVEPIVTLVSVPVAFVMATTARTSPSAYLGVILLIASVALVMQRVVPTTLLVPEYVRSWFARRGTPSAAP